MKKVLFVAASMLLMSVSVLAQTEAMRIVEDGGSGPFKAAVAKDASLPFYTIYRPADLKAAVEKNGKLPVVVFGNGGCYSATNVTSERLYGEMASHGYIVIGLGNYSENGIPKELDEEDNFENFVKTIGKELGYDNISPQDFAKIMGHSEPSQLTDAINWAQRQTVKPDSEYYHMIDADKVAAMGSSCGGLQAISISFDTRIKTVIMKNSGTFPNDNPMSKEFITKDELKEVKVPVMYVVGNETDVAFPNAMDDFERINHLPVAFCSYNLVGHDGSDRHPHGGEMATVIINWLDYYLKGIESGKITFTDVNYQKQHFPEWIMKSKNIQ